MEGGGTPFSSSMAPSGSYILIVVSQPVTDDHKKLILERLNKGLLSWDVESTGCDLSGLESVCANIDEKHLTDNDVLIQHSTESLGVEVLVSPTVSTLKQCAKNLLSTSTGHKHLIHVGYTFAGTGSWILQNGTFSFDDFLEIFQQADVQSQKRCNIHIHCAEVGSWNSTSFAENIFAKVANVAFNPPEKVNCVPGSEHLTDCLEKVLSSQGLEDIMKASPLVGNIRFNRPTLYLFPAGQGDCALFGVNGFNMLIDGGFNRKPCSWEFIRHLDRLDAVLVTRLCENNVCGMSTLMKRKSLNNTYPQIGYVFCNIAENNVATRKDEALSKDELIISVVGEGHNFTQTLNDLKLKPHQCWRDSSVEPFTLYHKVGHGTLEMHVLSPPKDSKEMKEFLSEWSSYKETFSKTNLSLKSKNIENRIPLSHSTSICAILVWRPADPNDTITRILFPGSAPQSKIFESLEKLKTLDVLKQPVVTKASLSVVTVTKSITKVEKSISKASIPNRRNTASPAPSVSSVASRNGDIAGVKKEVKKLVKEVKKENKEIKKEIVKKDVKKEFVAKEVKKTTTSIPKKDVTVKKETPKEAKKDNKDLKPLAKKENKDVKAVIDKKPDVKSAAKKVESSSAVSKTVSEVKKSTTTARKSAPALKKDAGKTTVQKTSEVRKSAPLKLSEPKTAKDVSNKKTAEAKAVPKTKPKSANTTPKATPKTKLSEVPKPGNKMTKAVAASSIVASAVAVTVAALELNEKNEEIVDVEPDVADELKEVEIIDKSPEINVSPLPPEVVSPTPSESISLTPSDTLSSAPLETVSPTPPLTNEPMSIEEKEVNEIKEIEQDIIPYEAEITQEVIEKSDQQIEDLEDDANEIELAHAKLQENADAMSTSFIGTQEVATPEIEEVVMKTEVTSEQFSANNAQSSYAEEHLEIKNTVENSEKQIDVDGTEMKETNVDDQLAHLSMEGSFCAGMLQQEKMNLPDDSNITSSGFEHSKDVLELKDDCYEKETDEKNETKMHESFIGETDEQHDPEIQESFVGEAEKEFKLEKQEGLEGETEKELKLEKQEGFAGETENDSVMHKSFVGETENEPKIAMHETFIGETKPFDYAQTSAAVEKSHYETEEPVGVQEKEDFELQIASNDVIKSNFENEFSVSDLDNKYVNEMQEKEITEKDYCIPPTVDRAQHEGYTDYEYGQHQEILASSVGHRMDDYDIPQNIIDDAEMQESSVDEPEEIVRKESAVSITLNDNELDVNYDDDLRRKSCTESEDDVDIQNYMINNRKDSFDQDKLNVKHDSDSDNEDVVKSPTPHAVVDYEGHIEDTIHDFEASREEKIPQDNTAYSTEKQDFDEKDRDSAEDEDDGEMIRHPTPPEMKYSEDEMRDPIGQHYITAPGLKSHVPDIVEQPLYEESEDVRSERSVSPVVEQPVFGNVVQADYPELVTVSGGTTPSEPQSPKTGFDSKKPVSETAVMDALSEHDCSESSTHSPLIHDGTGAFDLPVSEENFVNYESQAFEDKQESSVPQMVTKDLIVEEPSIVKDQALRSEHEPVLDNSAPIDEKLEKVHGADYDAPSDEESYSHEKSETRSEKSDGGDDEKSDFHRDDKSDNQHDGKSDIMDDDQTERKSDIHDDDRSDSHCDDYAGKETGGYEVYDKTQSHNTGAGQFAVDESNNYAIQFEKYGAREMQSDIDYSAHGELGIPHETSYGKEMPEILEKQEIASAMLNEKSDVPQFNEGTDINNRTESHLQSAEYEIAELENQEALKIPSGFGDENPNHDSYEGNISIDDRPGSYSANQIEPITDQVNMAQFETSGNVETMYDNHGELHSNIIPDLKDIPEYRTSSEFDRYENEDIGVMKHEEFQSTHESTFSGGLSLAESSIKESCHQSASLQLTDAYDDVSPQYSENFSGLENKVLTEMTEARQYETLSKFEENIHTSNAIYSENSLITNTVSDVKDSHEALSGTLDFDNSNYKYTSEEATHLISEKGFEQISTHKEQISYGETVETTYSKEHSGSLHMTANEDHDGIQYGHPTDFSFTEATRGFEESEFGNPNSGAVGIISQEESYVTKSSSFETKAENQETESSSFSDIRNKMELGSEHEATFGLTNGKDQTSWSHSGFTSQYETSSSVAETHTSYTTRSEQQETEYIINSRFHSDSPEDNVMRSDSSPDVPPYPVNSDGQLADVKNSVLGEYKEEYSNINLSSVGGVPLSPNKSRNANRDNTYAESSEEEDSTSVPGTVSPYAYTNKAYAKEEEDVDGNHIFKESFATEKTEILKEFDGNNPQTVTTHQMTYSQGYQETTGETNYDFRLEEWGKPMGLPTPPDSSNKTALKKSASKTKSSIESNGKSHSPSVASKLSSPLKKPKPKTTKESSSDPVYVDLAYVPHHGDPQYCDVEFFKKIRARYYVFSGINPSKEVLNALLEAKKSWKEDLEVTIIPTYETDTLGYWMAQNQDDLAAYSIEVAPSASRCTVNLQDHETSCAAYRLEF